MPSYPPEIKTSNQTSNSLILFGNYALQLLWVGSEILIKGGAFATIFLNTPGFNGSFQVFQDEVSAPGPVPKNGI